MSIDCGEEKPADDLWFTPALVTSAILSAVAAQAQCAPSLKDSKPMPVHLTSAQDHERTLNNLPVDSHELIALCAPRPVFIGGGVTPDDGWADTRGMFMAAAAAGPVYVLLGRKGLSTTEFPPVRTALINGDIGFRQHQYGHTDVPNWPTFLKFADRYMKAPLESAQTTPAHK